MFKQKYIPYEQNPNSDNSFGGVSKLILNSDSVLRQRLRYV